MYAGTQDNGVLRSDDRGKTWQPSGMQGYIVKAIAVSPVESGLIVAGTKPPGVFVSRDGGVHWEELVSFRKMRRWFWFSPAERPFTAYIQGIALSPTDPQVIVAGIEAGAVVRSTDGGKTWQNHRKGALRDCHSITFHVSGGDWVYEGGGTGAGASFSRDGGNSWSQVRKGLDRHYGWAAAADPARPDICYVSLSPGPMKAHSAGNAQAYIFRSIGGGAWEKLTGGLPQPLDYMPYALLTDRDAPRQLYAGLSNGDVWHTMDYGDHWQQLPVNLGSIWTAMIML
jgi:photosystem II stability/assembly factor-like uncharacterized protein